VAPPELRVTPDQLRSVGRDVLDVADQLNRDVGELSGEQEAITGASRGFSCMTAAADCEQGWQQSVEILGSKIAVSGDTLALNADSYAASDSRSAHGFRSR
jgi:hypothetical protein